MKWKIAGLLALALVDPRAASTADACGVKLTIKPTAPKKAVARSSNPSQVLLLGTHTRKFERELSAAGHSVEVVPTAGAAKQKNYAIVVTDPAKADEARTTFPGAVVMVRSGDVVADIRSVEGHVARKPKDRATDRTVVAAPRDRKPVETGPDPDSGRKVVATIEPTETPTPPPPKTEEPKKVETRPAVVETNPPPRDPEPKKVVEPKPKVVAAAAFASEIHFGYGGWGLNGATRNALDKTSRWLTEHSDVSVVLEGHADPSGNPDANMALAENRAARVKKYLESKGIDGGRMEVVSLGSTKLKYGASDARNRRVMIIKK
jgi:outer membrane protein OmpA-like peptidoglycan-associated protein